MEFEEAIKSVAAKVSDLKDSIETEEATKTAFIMPFIGQVLGYTDGGKKPSFRCHRV